MILTKELALAAAEDFENALAGTSYRVNSIN